MVAVDDICIDYDTATATCTTSNCCNNHTKCEYSTYIIYFNQFEVVELLQTVVITTLNVYTQYNLN